MITFNKILTFSVLIMSNKEKKQAKNVIEFEKNFWNEDKPTTAFQICRETFNNSLIINSPVHGTKLGNNTLMDIYEDWRSGFPNMKLENIKTCFASNFVFVEWNSECIHEGVFNGIPPTYKKVKYHGKAIYQLDDTSIINYMCYIDMVDFYKQMGVFLQKEEYDNQSTIKNNYTLLTSKIMEITSNAHSRLTLKEIEVLSFWIAGYSLKGISSVFSISPRTVESHIEHIKYKLGCNSKCDFINFIRSKQAAHLLRDLYLLLCKLKGCF